MRNFLLILLIIGVVIGGLTGCERSMTKPMMDDTMTPSEMPTMDDPEAFAVALVQAAVDLYKANGAEAAITYYNDPASIDGQWYVFITDPDDIFVAHPAAPNFIGTDLKIIPGLDGSLIGVEIAMATEDGQWTEYLWPNPDTNKLEQKRTWSIRHDGYLFSAGYYDPWAPDPATLTLASKEDLEAFTHDFVLAAITRYEFTGVDATATYYNDPASIDGQWYVFITDPDDIFVAHAPKQDLVGTPLQDVLSLDGSYSVGAEIAKATKTGLWIEYEWPNPASGENEMKRTWAIRHDNHLFGSGYYEPITQDDMATMEGAETAVEGSMPAGN